jgi:hypothetical protein
MNYINIYVKILKNKNNYNFIFYNESFKILLTLNIKYNFIFKLNHILYLKLIKSYFFENGLKILLIES